MAKKVKRVQLDLAEKAMARLDKLKDDTEANSYAEVVKNSLRLYEALIAETEAGSTFLVKDSDGVLSKYNLWQ